MTVYFRNLIIATGICFVQALGAQELMTSRQSFVERQQVINNLRPDEERRIAGEFARRNNLPERVVYKDGTILEIRRISSNGHPMYYKTTNKNSAETISSDEVREGGLAGLELDGTGMVVGVWDGGAVRITHDEFEARARILDGANDYIDHATHVAGTIGAAGIRSSAHGMANKSIIDSYDWDNDNDEMSSAAGNGLLISNHSYGFVHGWQYDSDLSRWEWHGDAGISEKEEYGFGYYGVDARIWDDIARDHPRYLIVKSAGNDRGDGPAPGTSHYYYSNGAWRESTMPRDLDGGVDGFDCIGTQGTAKNILTVGAVDDIPGGYESPSDVRLASYSAFGPTDDGRIKPDLVANGLGLYSTTSGSDTEYGFSSGTSMASPSVAGSLALLQQHYFNLKGSFMFASQLKALVLHTTDEAGNPGPDYKHGWGLMNTMKAAELITSIPDERFLYKTLAGDGIDEYVFFCRGSEEVRITLAWTDPRGLVPPLQLNPKNRILVNDLDITLTRQVDDHMYRPYILDPANPSKEAQTGDNMVDNVEQISLQMPLPGFYTLRVSHKNQLEDDQQAYGLIVTGLDKDYVASGRNELEDANGSILLSSAGTYLNNMKVEWAIETNNGQPVSFYFDWFETEEEHDVLTIYDGTDTTAPVIGHFSGSLPNADTIVTSSSDVMFITFNSDEQITASGFLARYCTVAPEGEFTITGEPFPCENTISSYFAVGQEGAYFDWESGNGWDFTAITANGIEFSIGDTTESLLLKPYNLCATGKESTLLIEPLDAPPVIASVQGDTLPCVGVSSLLTTNFSPGVTYLWNLPEKWVGSSVSDSLYFIPGEISGVITVAGQNACGSGNELSKQINVLDIPDTPNILTEKVPPCAHTVQNFYVNGLPGHSYSWQVQDDWEIMGGEEEDTVTVEIGGVESFLFVTTINDCGIKEGSRLFLTSPVPPTARVNKYDGSLGLPELEVTNTRDIESIQWYMNGEPVQGESGTSNPLVVNLNGIYWAETISEEECRNPGSEQDWIQVNRNQLSFLVYRANETTIYVENTTSRSVNFRLVSLSGQVVYHGEANPGHNEISFLGTGIYLVRFFGDGVNEKYKAFL